MIWTVTKVKYLGVIIDNNLNFKHFIDYVQEKMLPKLVSWAE